MTDLMTQGRAVYRCPCGCTVVDDRDYDDDDELAFELVIDDHEAGCFRHAEQRAWEASTAPGVRQVPALIAEQLEDEQAVRDSTAAMVAMMQRLAALGTSAHEATSGLAALEEVNRQAGAELDDVIYPGFRRLLIALLVGTVVLTGMILVGQAWPVVLVGALAGVVFGGAGEWAIARMRGRS